MPEQVEKAGPEEVTEPAIREGGPSTAPHEGWLDREMEKIEAAMEALEEEK